MSERLITAAGALAALALLAALLFPGGSAPDVSRPTSMETGPNGYAGLWRWLEQEGVPLRSLRTRLDVLTHRPPAGRGNLLITTLPHRHRLRYDEREHLRGWIAAGNTLLVLAALNDTPAWSLNVDTSLFLADLQSLTGLSFGAPENQASRGRTGSIGGVTTMILEGLPEHPLMADVGELHGESDSPAAVWAARRSGQHGPAVVALARDPDTGVGGLWQARLGEGQVIVASLGSLLTNRVIGAADNRRLMANLLTYHLDPGGMLIFDDMHQGLSELYDPDAFFRDPRLGVSLLFVLGFWILYLIGGSDRLAPPVPRRARPRQNDFVGAVGGFLARKLSPAEAGRRIVEDWLDELRRRDLIDGSGPPWPALARLAALEPRTLERLRRQHDALERGGEVNLPQVHNTIEELRRMLR